MPRLPAPPPSHMHGDGLASNELGRHCVYDQKGDNAMFFTNSYEQERVFDLLLFAVMAAMLYAAYWKARYKLELNKRAEDNRAASKARDPRGRCEHNRRRA